MAEANTRRMRSAGSDGYFRKVVLSDDTGVLKPHAAMFHFALSATQSHLEEPLMVGDSKAAVRLAQCLQRKGFYVMPVRPPTVPEGTSRIRISLTADVTLSEVEAFLSNVPMASEVMKGGSR